MKLFPGQPAPLFDAEDIHGQPVSLIAFRGKRVMLSFYRNSACALCNLQVHKVSARYPVYRARGLEVIAVFESPKEQVIRHVGRQSPPFPVIADPHARLYDLYGVERSEKKVAAAVRLSGGGYLAPLIAQARSVGYELTEEPGANFLRIPADFLIDEAGTIHAARYAERIGMHIPEGDIEGFLADEAP